MKKLSCVLLILFLSSVTAFSQTPAVDDADDAKRVSPQNVYRFPTAKERFKRFLKDTAGPQALAGSAISAGVSQITETPPEWEKNGTGYARRFGSNVGEKAIEQTTKYALSEAFGQDQRYVRCRCEGVGKRTVHALKSGFTARNRKGKTVFSPAKTISPFVSTVTSTNVWYPDRYSTKDGMRRGGYRLGFNVGFNLIREFLF